MNNLLQTINTLGDARSIEFGAAKMDGCAIALFQVAGNVHGTHWVGVFDGSTLQQLPICDEAAARNTFLTACRAMRAAAIA